MKIDLTEIYAGLKAWRHERGITAQSQKEGYIINVMEEFGELSQALGRLLAVTENYPELKANENFKQLMDQLEGTENRITFARNTFNDTAKEYNTFIRRFPANIVASMFGFQYKPYFKAEEGAEKAPKVEF